MSKINYKYYLKLVDEGDQRVIFMSHHMVITINYTNSLNVIMEKKVKWRDVLSLMSHI